PGLRIAHGTGIVIGNGVRIGRDCLLMQNVTLGAPSQARIGEMPALGDRVFVGAGAVILGPLHVGDDCFIGAHALVTEDVPPNTKVLPAGGVELRPRRQRGQHTDVR
ncbi:MAG TPA: serine acetyltransferase, partial [Gaiellaceae bacterium]|nr:serine acetyltransferase [Gaiellaceae bacterium]